MHTCRVLNPWLAAPPGHRQHLQKALFVFNKHPSSATALWSSFPLPHEGWVSQDEVLSLAALRGLQPPALCAINSEYSAHIHQVLAAHWGSVIPTQPSRRNTCLAISTFPLLCSFLSFPCNSPALSEADTAASCGSRLKEPPLPSTTDRYFYISGNSWKNNWQG